VEVIAGVATGAIAQAALVADTLLPFVYIRLPQGSRLENMMKVICVQAKCGDRTLLLPGAVKSLEAIRNDGSECLNGRYLTYVPVAEQKFRRQKSNDYLMYLRSVLSEALSRIYSLPTTLKHSRNGSESIKLETE